MLGAPGHRLRHSTQPPRAGAGLDITLLTINAGPGAHEDRGTLDVGRGIPQHACQETAPKPKKSKWRLVGS